MKLPRRLGLWLTAGPLLAQEPLPPRASFTTNAALQSPGDLSLELGVHGSNLRDESSNRSTPMQLLLGLTDRLDARIFWNGWQSTTDQGGVRTHGGMDPWAGLQARLFRQESAGLDISLGYWHKFPRASVSKGLGNGRHEDQILLALSRIQASFLLDLNLIQNRLADPDGSGRLLQHGAAACLTWSPGPRLHLSVEVYTLEKTRTGPRLVSNLWALGYAWNDRITLDLGFEVGLTRGAPRQHYFAGISYPGFCICFSSPVL